MTLSNRDFRRLALPLAILFLLCSIAGALAWATERNARQAMLERNFLKQVFEQQRLVGQQQRITVQQVDLELAYAHLVHKGVTRQIQRGHTRVDFIEEGP